MNGDVTVFVDKYYPEALEKRTQLLQAETPIEKTSTGNLFLFFLDFDDNYPLYPKIIQEFCCTYHGTDHGLVLAFGEKFTEQQLKQLSEILNKFDAYDVSIQLIDCSQCLSADTLIVDTDVYITNRQQNNLARFEIAHKFGKKIISGVDLPIF